MKEIRHSHQRDAILGYLRSTKSHPTAEAVYNEIRKEIPNISMGTVYRNLSLLVEMGEAKRVNTPDASEHFDADMSPHCHMVCSECGRVIDIFIDSNSIEKEASKNFSGRITGSDILFHGVCGCCQN